MSYLLVFYFGANFLPKQCKLRRTSFDYRYSLQNIFGTFHISSSLIILGKIGNSDQYFHRRHLSLKPDIDLDVENLVSERKGHQLQGGCDENTIIDTRLRLFLECVTIFADTSSFI